MGKRISNDDVIAIALLYRKKYVGTDMISYDKVCKFDLAIDKNLDMMDVDCGTDIGNENDSKIYFKMLDEKGMECVVINPYIDIKKEWDRIFGYLPVEFCVAIEMDNVLKEIDLITVDEKIRDINSYYSELKEKYHLFEEFRSHRPFDIFRDWENIPVDGYVEFYCISENDRNVLIELRNNRDKNMESVNKQINRLKRVKKK